MKLRDRIKQAVIGNKPSDDMNYFYENDYIKDKHNRRMAIVDYLRSKGYIDIYEELNMNLALAYEAYLVECQETGETPKPFHKAMMEAQSKVLNR